MRRFAAPIAVLLLFALSGCGRAGAPQESAAGSGEVAVEAWAAVLRRAHWQGGLDYSRLAADRGDLDRFLASLDAARAARWPRAEQLAFWINAYNAVVVDFVLERYPDLVSVKEEDGFFSELTFPVAGEELTLDEIEARALALDEPRVHFAVVCASTSCPDLRFEPYVPARLDEQLDEQTRTFLADESKGLRFDAADEVVWLSSIFKWYAGDFTGGSTVVAFFVRGKVLAWVLPYLPPELAERIEAANPAVRYLEYDWGLNDRRRPAGE